MATKIAWCEETWNPITGCTPISPGCANCYAKRMANRLRGRHGYPKDEPFRVTFHADKLGQPLHWKKHRKVFVCSMGDLFHDDVSNGSILDIWRIMRNAPQLTFLVLTKRPQRTLKWFERWADTKEADYEPKLARGPDAVRKVHTCGRSMLFADMIEGWGIPPEGAAYPPYDWMEGMWNWPLIFPNVWLGVSCENQEWADKRIPELLKIPAAVRWLSLEPLLGPIDFWNEKYIECPQCKKTALAGLDPRRPLGMGPTACFHCGSPRNIKGQIDWVVVGCESGPGRRPCKLEWVRSIVDQCTAARVPVFVKQIEINGEVEHDVNKFPTWAQRRETPK